MPLLFGASSVHEEDGRRRSSNSAFLVGADGMIRDAYDKNLLIPLAEYVPLARLLPSLERLVPARRSDFARRDRDAARCALGAVADRDAHLLRGDPAGVRAPHDARSAARTCS